VQPRRHPETAVGYQTNNEAAERAAIRRRQMRTLSLILAFAFILAGPSVAGTRDGDLPGVGAFAYNGAAAATATAPSLLVAGR
jgi:hypothetical protein